MEKRDKKTSWAEMTARQLEKSKRYKGKREKTDHDLIAYGVSRDGTTLEDFERKKKRK